MSRPLKLLGGVVVVMVLLVAGLYAYRSLMLYDGRTPEGYAMLTAMPGVEGFEPGALPAGPILSNQSASDLAVTFGYKVGGIPYSYALDLSFPAKPEAAKSEVAKPDPAKPKAAKPEPASDPDPSDNVGKATVIVRHANREGRVDSTANRRWDGPRHAYAVALEDRFDVDPAVPALCIKAVIGPSATRYDLKAASLCVAQRDVKGTCHPETLACGLIR